jgi:rare lipoprotein A
MTLAACASGPRPPAAGVATQGQPSPDYGGYKVGKPYQVHGVWYYPKDQPNYDEIGIASWYGYQFHNQNTADGEVFDMNLPSAAHKTLPLPSLVEVTNLANGKTLVVRVNDRGPFVDGRIIDLSKEAASELGFVTAGVTKVRVRYVGRAPDPPGSDGAMHPRQEIARASKAAPQLASNRPAAPPADLANSPPQHPIPYSQLAASTPATLASASRPAAAIPSQAYQAFTAAKPAPVPAGPALPDVDALLADKPAAVASAAVPATYELQAGSFATEDAARHFASGLTGGGLPEVQAVRDGAEVTYRVVVHGLANPAEAAAARSEAMALGAPKALIVGGS